MAIALPGRIQIAGVIDQADAETIIATGADMLGFPLGLKDGREDLDVDEAATIIANTAHRATSVVITYLDSANDVWRLCDRLGVRWVQLHGPINLQEVRSLKARDQQLGIIKSLIVHHGDGDRILEEARKFEPLVDAFITDTFDPETCRSGATGKTHDWSVSRGLVEQTSLPVILAGGLVPGNVADAVAAVGPAAVDAHTGVENETGRKCPDLLSGFVTAATRALDRCRTA